MAKKMQIEIDQEEQKKKDLELKGLTDAEMEEALLQQQQQQQKPKEAMIDLGEDESFATKIKNAYDKFVQNKNASGGTADWEGKHNITDKSKLPNAAKVGLTIVGVAIIFALLSLTLMGMLVAALAIPFVVGGLYLANKGIRNYVSPADSSVWGKEQRDLVNSANITDITTTLRNMNLNCKTKDHHEIKTFLGKADFIAKSISNNYMSAEELKSKLEEASQYIARCEALITRNQNLDSEMKGLKVGIDALPPDARKDIYEKYNELEERLDKGATSVTYDDAMKEVRVIRKMLNDAQAALPRPVQAVPVQQPTPKSVSPSAPNMSEVAAQNVLQQTDTVTTPTSRGVRMSHSPNNDEN